MERVRERVRTRVGMPVLVLGLLATGCGGDGETSSDPSVTSTSGQSSEPGGGDASGEVEVGRGVDAESKTIRVGTLADLSGQLAIIGVPSHAAILAGIDALNESDVLSGWTIEVEERDHGFNPSNAVSMYEEVRDDVLLVAHSLGTSTTAPLLPRFAEDDMLAFVCCGASTTMTSHSIWGLSPYRADAARAVDHAFEDAGSDVRFGIVRGNEDSGADALDGVTSAADALGVEVVADVALEPTTDNFTAAVLELEDAGATHVLSAIGAGQTGNLLSSAADQAFEPQWYGTLPSVIEPVMFGTLPPQVWADNFLWVHGLPYWGEDRPGMEELTSAYEASEAAETYPAPQFYGMVAWLHVQMMGEVLSRAIDAGDLTPQGVVEAAASVDDFDADGLLLSSVDLIGEQPTTVSRVLAPDVENQTWNVVGEVKELEY